MDSDLDSTDCDAARKISPTQSSLRLVIFQSRLFPEDESICLPGLMGLAPSSLHPAASCQYFATDLFALDLNRTASRRCRLQSCLFKLNSLGKSPPQSAILICLRQHCLQGGEMALIPILRDSFINLSRLSQDEPQDKTNHDCDCGPPHNDQQDRSRQGRPLEAELLEDFGAIDHPMP